MGFKENIFLSYMNSTGYKVKKFLSWPSEEELPSGLDPVPPHTPET